MQNKEQQILVRFRKLDEIYLVEKFKKRCKANGANINSEIKEIIIYYLKNQEKKNVFKDLKNDIYMSFEKAIFNRTQGITKSIFTTTKPIGFEVDVLNEKMNLVINMLTGNVKNISNINEIPDIAFNESNSFKKARKIFESGFQEQRKVLNKKAVSADIWAEKYSNHIGFGDVLDDEEK